jgi:hypothetical protein
MEMEQLNILNDLVGCCKGSQEHHVLLAKVEYKNREREYTRVGGNKA